jgi:benzoyl-CoA reductase/2-hydroxyglutaryl-CoA dehydratase subunit BcrC/BadD/HgdB
VNDIQTEAQVPGIQAPGGYPPPAAAEGTAPAPEGREARRLKAAGARLREEIQRELAWLREREDYFPELEAFLELLEDGPNPSAAAARSGRPLVALMCLQAPLELFHALGLQPFKVYGGSHAGARLSSPLLPAIMCPMLRSALGALSVPGLRPEDGWKAFVAPTTCDWVVKIDELFAATGVSAPCPSWRLELPHLKDRPESQERWLEEIYGLKTFLLKTAGLKKLDRKELRRSMEIFQRAWRAFSELTDLKRDGRAPLVWCAAAAGSFFHDEAESWTRRLEAALPGFRKRPRSDGSRPKVFLAGSPVFFPNLKVIRLLEEAGLECVMDDLCSSERVFPGAVFCDDRSEHGLMKALAQRYHQGCLCPTFADNDRRVNNICATAHKRLYSGVVFHVLKGCHPFDLESVSLEGKIKGEGLKFIKIETDYTAEDSQTLLTRLEAFRSSLAG